MVQSSRSFEGRNPLSSESVERSTRPLFPISATAQTQSLFERDVALMHSFQYEEAAQAFDDAVRRDSRCAMCHWGKAMVLYQQIWQWPSVSEVATGLQEIRLARPSATSSARASLGQLR